MNARTKKGLEALLKMDRTRLCEMVEDYAKCESLYDLKDCWEEVRESLCALIWIEEQLKKEEED